MEKRLEYAYKEEYVRAKARKDYEQCLAAKNAPKKKKNEKFYQALPHIIWGAAALFLLFQIYIIFG